MNNKKLVLTIFATLAGGFIIGFFTSGRLAHRRMDKLRNMMYEPKAEQRHFIKKLQLSDEQIAQISPIMDTMVPNQMKLRKKHRKEMDAERIAMFDEIKKYLNDEQNETLTRMKSRMSQRPAGPPRRRHQR